jgi:hypothetical protein
MMMRSMVLGLAVAVGLSVWAWCRPCEKEAQAQQQGPETVVAGQGASGEGNRDEAFSRYRGNQSRHWRQVALSR